MTLQSSLWILPYMIILISQSIQIFKPASLASSSITIFWHQEVISGLKLLFLVKSQGVREFEKIIYYSLGS